MAKQNQYQRTDEEFIEAVKSSTNIHQALLKLNLNGFGGAYQVFKDRCSKLQLDTSHFQTDATLKKIITDEAILFACSNNYSKQSTLNSLQLNSEVTTNLFWIDRKIQQLKININHWDLQTLKQDTDNNHKIKLSRNKDDNLIKSGDSKKKQYKKTINQPNAFCSCGKAITERSLNCKSCTPKKNKIQWLPCDQIIEIVKSVGYSEAGKKLGVSDNAIRKHLKRNGYQLP
jgi:hypothetical protein